MDNENNFAIDKEGNLIKSSKVVRKIRKSKLDYNVMNLGYYLAVPILFGTFLGIVIDSKFHTQGASVVAGILLGGAASIYNLIKLIKSNA